VYCVFCQADDLPALWAYHGLKRKGLVPLEIFTPEALVFNRRLEHRLQASQTHTCIELVDGRVLVAEQVAGVLNRINRLPGEHFGAAAPEDRAYAVQEQQAVFLSWMYALPGVMINRPAPRGLSGDPRSPAEWAWLAVQAALPIRPFVQSEARTVESRVDAQVHRLVILDGAVYGATGLWCNQSIKDSIIHLSDMSGLRLFGLEFAINHASEPFFVSATLLPDLRLGGEPLLDALLAALQ
jgi:hypothetical protein